MNVYSLCIPRKSVRRNGIRTLCRRTRGTVLYCHRILKREEKRHCRKTQYTWPRKKTQVWINKTVIMSVMREKKNIWSFDLTGKFGRIRVDYRESLHRDGGCGGGGGERYGRWTGRSRVRKSLSDRPVTVAHATTEKGRSERGGYSGNRGRGWKVVRRGGVSVGGAGDASRHGVKRARIGDGDRVRPRRRPRCTGSSTLTQLPGDPKVGRYIICIYILYIYIHLFRRHGCWAFKSLWVMQFVYYLYII